MSFGTIVISGKVEIEKNCNIAHSATIGQVNREKLKGYSTIGDKVWIGTSSGIVGNINRFECINSPNSFVNMDMPDNALVIGNPAKIIKKEILLMDRSIM